MMHKLGSNRYTQCTLYYNNIILQLLIINNNTAQNCFIANAMIHCIIFKFITLKSSSKFQVICLSDIPWLATLFFL